MLTPVGDIHWHPNKVSPIKVGEETLFDWDNVISLDIVRQHTKTEDVIGVTDEILAIYRAAAIGAAERYTGYLLSGHRTVTEPIDGPRTLRPGKSTYKFRLRYPVADGIVYLYGGIHPNDNRAFHVRPNARTIDIPVRFSMVDVSNCCNPCSQPLLNQGMLASYKAGFACVADIPAGVILGCLQYIAWVVEHPGDEILTVRNRRDARSEGAQGTNNIAIASGALETWRTLDEDIV